MGTVIGSKDWSQHPLGEIEQWPAGLRIAIANALKSKFPKFLFWGEELFCFYNDGFLKTLDDPRYVSIVGERAEEAIPIMWPFISAHRDEVMKNGNALWFENMEIPILREGEIKDYFWTLSPSPLYDEYGDIKGILVTSQETTQNIRIIREAVAGQEKVYNLLKQAPMGISLVEGKDMVYTFANEPYLEFIGRSAEEVLNKNLWDAVPEAKSQLGLVIQNVYETGEAFYGFEYPIVLLKKGLQQTIYFNFVYAPIKDKDDNVFGILTIVSDVTEMALSKIKFRDAEERLRLSTENNNIATWDLNLAMRELIHSDYLSEIFGYQKGLKFSYHQLREMLLPEDKTNIVEPAFAEAIKTGEYKYEARLQRPDGEIRWIKTHGRIIYDEKNYPQRMVGIMQDITDSKLQQIKLQNSEERYRNLADFMPQFIWTSNKDGELNYFNKAVLDYCGLSSEELAGKPGWLSIVHPDDREQNIIVWKQSTNSHLPFSYEHRFRNKNDEYRWQLSRAIPIKNEEGTILYWLGTSTDINEIKKDEQLRNDFIKMANHELKTPVTTIKGYVQLLLKSLNEKSDPLLVSSLNTINKQVNKLTALITDLLDITKIEIGSLPLHMEVKNLSNEIAVSLREVQTTSANHEFIFDEEGTDDLYALIDSEKFSQVLSNLYNNAMKYSDNSNKIIVTLAKGEDNGAVISIQDFGIGIAASDHSKIFEQFYRVSGKDEKTYPGFGIGLFIVDEIVKKHQGRIWVESVKGEGSTFKIWLPLVEKPMPSS